MDKIQQNIYKIEDTIFEELKDGYFGGINYIRSKYEGSGIDFDRLYRRLTNYRYETYGTTDLNILKKIILNPKKDIKRYKNNKKVRGLKNVKRN